MTTVAYRAGILAADTMLTAGATKLPERARKVFRLRDGRLFGSSGDAENGLLLLESLQRGQLPPRAKDVLAILIDPNGKIFCWEGKRWSQIYGAEYVAIGHGAGFALGALAHGATAEEAVRIGIKLDTHSGGRVQSVSLKKKRRSRR